MADEAYAGEEHSLKAKLAELTAGARDVAHGALTEAMAWTVYQWTVLALLTAIFILVALSYGGIRTELAALKQQQGGMSDQDLTRIGGEIGQQLSGMKSDLMQSITGLDDKIAKFGAKLDARSAPKPAAPAPKPAARPRPQ